MTGGESAMSKIRLHEVVVGAGIWKPMPPVLAFSLAVFLLHDVLVSLTAQIGWDLEFGSVYVKDYPPLAALLDVCTRPWSLCLFAPISVVLRFERDCPPALMRLLITRGARRSDALRAVFAGVLLHAAVFWLAHVALAAVVTAVVCKGSYDITYLRDLYDAGAAFFVYDTIPSSLLLCAGSILLAVSPSIVAMCVYLQTERIGAACAVPATLWALRTFGVDFFVSAAPALMPLWEVVRATAGSLVAISLPVAKSLSIADMAQWMASNLAIPALCAVLTLKDRRLLLGGR